MELWILGFEILLFTICITAAILCIAGGVCVLKLVVDFLKGNSI